ncbi:MAG: efflux RND transporter periplasmic adaptor subunit [Planctomycetes bacterium]|nr:efflux RND transporter periplasmic adaptor subunit [Planctomycetota bacterium]
MLRSTTRTVVAALPTLLVLVLLGAVGVWGHRTGWKAPKLAELFGGTASVDEEDWCATHNVPDSNCIACHPELAGENGADWCREHGVPESKCTACHPELLETGVAADWCAEHGLPESGCTLCHPELARKGELPRDADAVVVASDVEARTEGAAPESKAERAARTCQTHALKVQFASAASMDKCGIRLGQVVERAMADSVLVNARADYDRTHFARLASKAAGTAWRVEHAPGDALHAGDILAWIEAPEIGRAKAELLLAQAEAETTARAAARVSASSDAGFRTEAERGDADAAARSAGIRLFQARRTLANFGFALPEGSIDASAIARLGLPASAAANSIGADAPGDLYPVKMPFDGVVVARDVVLGETVEPDRILFEVADTTRMGVTMDVPESEAGRVKLGASVLFRPDHAADEPIAGRVAWISTAVDPTTRTVQVRADVENGAGTLRAHAFGRARIVVRTSPAAVAVPTEAVQWEGCCHVVFVQIGAEIFQTRKVRLGTQDAYFTEIQGGVLPGEVVVTTGSHVLESEILKSKLGAGCCAAE